MSGPAAHCAGALSVTLPEGGEKRPDPAPARPFSRHVSGRVLCHVRPRWRPSYGERVRGRRGSRKGREWSLVKTAPERARGARAPASPRQLGRVALPRVQVVAGPGLWRAAWGERSARPALARRAGRPSPSSPSVPSRPVPSGAAGRVLRRVGGSGDIFWLSFLPLLPFPLLRGAGRPSGPRMQNVINTVKGKALEVAEYLTPVLKVSRPCEGLAGTRLALQGPRTWRRGVTVVSGGGRCSQLVRVVRGKRCSPLPRLFCSRSDALCVCSLVYSRRNSAPLGTLGWKVVRSQLGLRTLNFNIGDLLNF